ncbi:MAG: nucleotide-binding protein [Streptosporangiaceae bacterium]
MAARTARIFIGSSSEALGAAHAVRSLLAADADITLWNEGFFRQGHGFLESLTASLDSFDFAILIATPDDLATTRGRTVLSPRDNILFELGLFMGKLGRERVWLIHPRNSQLKLPSDLLGIVTASADWPQSDGEHGRRCSLKQYMSALGAVCDEIRDALREWYSGTSGDLLLDPGLLCCYTNATEAQAAIGKAIAVSRSEMFFMGINFSYTPVLNDAEFKEKVECGVNVNFMVLNPMTRILGYVARGAAMSEERLRAENKLDLKTIVDLQRYADLRHRELPTAGKIAIRLFDAIPLGRAYVFDGPDGESFFVPYASRGPVRPLPVYHCANSGRVAKRYINGMKELWESEDAISVSIFLERYPEFLI